jgi:alkylation response protein AidB-like acyl-CoA dehydrogenase
VDFHISDEQRAIRDAVGAVVRRFEPDYWLARDDDGEFPHEFHRAMAAAGWLGITMPEAYGGAGLGVTEPDAGLDTTHIKTFAEKVDGGYLVNGQKVWTSAGQVATKIMMTHGGFGYAKEYHVERLLREVTITRIAPVTEQLIKCFIAEKVLDLPKSY